MSRKKPRKNLEECPKQKNYQKRIEDLRAEEIFLKNYPQRKTSEITTLKYQKISDKKPARI